MTLFSQNYTKAVLTRLLMLELYLAMCDAPTSAAELALTLDVDNLVMRDDLVRLKTLGVNVRIAAYDGRAYLYTLGDEPDAKRSAATQKDRERKREYRAACKTLAHKHQLSSVLDKMSEIDRYLRAPVEVAHHLNALFGK